LEQLPATLALRVGSALDLVPQRLGPVEISFPLGHDPLQVEPLGSVKEIPATLINRKHLREHSCGRWDECGQSFLPSSQRQSTQILSSDPERVERGVVKIAAAG
jgi:hypothetical protein